MKKVFALILALTMLCSVAFAADTDIAILVPNADHGWTGAVMTYAEEKAAAVNEEGTYTAQVITSSDPANQITQVEDIIENQSANTVVILPQDNTLEVTMRRLADSGIPFVMFDRVIDSVSEQAVASVKGDNEGIGAETAKRFIEDGMVPGDKILIIPGDNSSVPQMRNDGFFGVLLENGWTQEQIDAIEMTAYTGWSRSEGRRCSPSGWTARPLRRSPSTSGSSPTTTRSPWASSRRCSPPRSTPRRRTPSSPRACIWPPPPASTSSTLC